MQDFFIKLNLDKNTRKQISFRKFFKPSIPVKITCLDNY